YDDYYVHDCFVRNDTMYASEITKGQFSVTDVHNKVHPTAFVRQETPFAFSHNTWLSDDGRYLFNTDEKKFAPVTSYDISDLNNIKELDQYRHSDVDSSIAHNTYYRDGYLYTSYYHDGVTIADAHKPDNMIEIGWFDTSPVPPSSGFAGCWGVYPFFPSGNIICSDRQEGLFVLSPTLKRACYLEGTVTDQAGNRLPNIRTDIIGHPRYKRTDILGNYKTGIGDSGLYDVRFTDLNNHCQTVIIGGVELKEGIVKTLDVALECETAMGIENSWEELLFTAMPTVFSNTTQVKLRHSTVATAGIWLIDASGKLLKQYSIDTPEATLVLGNDLSAGVYFIRAESNRVSKVLRIVKQ
ncbi:MAG TPA: choice-of-anchor B family protein, partial [Chitinophagales bacterium]|nr:choice-of-anchor B family protein [Chitinophagales bacterium]